MQDADCQSPSGGLRLSHGLLSERVCAIWATTGQAVCSDPCAGDTDCGAGQTCAKLPGSANVGFCEAVIPQGRRSDSLSAGHSVRDRYLPSGDLCRHVLGPSALPRRRVRSLEIRPPAMLDRVFKGTAVDCSRSVPHAQTALNTAEIFVRLLRSGPAAVESD